MVITASGIYCSWVHDGDDDGDDSDNLVSQDCGHTPVIFRASDISRSRRATNFE